MEHTIKINNLPKGELVQNFTNYELLKNNPKNRCCFYRGEEEKARKAGYTEKEIKNNISLIDALILSILTNGYIGLIAIPIFKTKRGVMYLLDAHHLVRAIIEVSKKSGVTIPINIVVYKETKTFTFDRASQMMCDMNKNGARPWEFVEVMRNYGTPNAKKFMELYKKYAPFVSSVAVIADSTIDVATSTKRANIEKNWGREEDTTWKYANEYLYTLTNINCTRSFSQASADAFRTLYKSADSFGVRHIFNDIFLNGKITISFGKGRPNTMQWMEQFVSAIIANRPRYCTLKASEVKKFKAFLADAKKRVDWEGLYNNYKGVA